MKKGEKKKQAILDCAVSVLVEGGYAELSIRKVTEKAGIQVGNLQFYFPTRASLIEAMLEREIDRYETALAEASQLDEDSNGDTSLMRTVDYLLSDQENQDSCIVFWELWALAAHDVTAATIMNRHYKRYLGAISTLVQEASPQLTRPKADRIALLIVSLIEGASILRGYQKPKTQAVRTAKKDIEAAIRLLVRELDT